jgi:hypothetical protein
MPPRSRRRPPHAPTRQRLWRLRKLHQSVEAALDDGAGGACELRFFYNGALALARRCASRAEAEAEAALRRRELEREGWTAHW